MECNQRLSPEIERQQAALALVGGALLLVQTAESAIKACMTYALPKHSPLTLKALQQQQSDERRRTLGYFLHELRKRADINSSFDVELDQFLEDRNTLVHRLRDIEGFDLGTEAGCSVASEFASNLIRTATRVTKIFGGLLRAWQKQVGMKDSPGYEALLPDLDQYAELVDYIFYEKKQQEHERGAVVCP